jgi:hypothetical protein
MPMKYKDRKMIKRPEEKEGPKAVVTREDRLNAYHGRLRGLIDERDISAFLFYVMTKPNVMKILNSLDALNLMQKNELIEVAREFHRQQSRKIGEPDFRKEEPLSEPIVK